jgi:hypothetical protein
MALQKKSPSSRREFARKWRRKGLKRLNPGSEIVVGRKPRTYKIWYAATPADEPRE